MSKIQKLMRFVLTILFVLQVISLFSAYYDNATGTGQILKANLHTIITNGHNPLSYDGAKLKLFQNTFNVNGYVRCVYTGQDFSIPAGYNGSTSPNTEHTFCQSWFGSSEASTKKSDLHHLFPTQQNVNSSRGNIPFGVVENHSTATTYTSYNNFHSFRGANSSSQNVFEPADQYKGDIARALLYFSVRYNMGLTIDGVDMLPVLLDWTVSDPVDTFEQSRNDMNYTYQGNRNPFIDHPEWVASIWQNTNPTIYTNLYFDNQSLVVQEGSGTCFMSIRISNPSPTTQTTCRVSLTNGSSSKIDNFSYQILNFPANSTSTISIPISITDNNIIDGNQTLTFTIENVTGGNNAYSEMPNTFDLTIQDNDFAEQSSNFTEDLFFSEYVEGTSNNKYVEIFNGTGVDVDLSNYQLDLYSNGSSTTTSSVTLSGILAQNAVKVYKNSQAALSLPNGVIAETNGSVNFNGDDALVLKKINPSQVIDVFGYVGYDPGTAWTIDNYSTIDRTLRRKSNVFRGIFSPANNTFPTLNTEWDVFSVNTADGLGSHSYTYNTPESNADHQAFIDIDNSDMIYEFGNQTAIKMFFNSINGSGVVKVKKYDSIAENISFNELTPQTVIPYRWVFSNSNSITDFNVNLILDLNVFSNHGLTDLNQVKLYHRSTPGEGTFEYLGYMVYDQETNTLNFDGISSFSEFILGSDNQTLPVTLSSFNAVLNNQNNSVILNWTTQSETELLGYYVYGSHQNDFDQADRKSLLISAQNSSNQASYQWTDQDIREDYNYWLMSMDRSGSSQVYGPVSVKYDDPNNPPSDTQYITALKSIYPNPFNPKANISFSIADEGLVKISVYNIKGECVKVIKNERLNKGNHSLIWNGTNQSNLPCANGIYFIRLQTDNQLLIKKAIMLK